MPTKKQTAKVKDLPAKNAKRVKAGFLSSTSTTIKSLGEALNQAARKG